MRAAVRLLLPLLHLVRSRTVQDQGGVVVNNLDRVTIDIAGDGKQPPVDVELPPPLHLHYNVADVSGEGRVVIDLSDQDLLPEHRATQVQPLTEARKYDNSPVMEKGPQKVSVHIVTMVLKNFSRFFDQQ